MKVQLQLEWPDAVQKILFSVMLEDFLLKQNILLIAISRSTER